MSEDKIVVKFYRTVETDEKTGQSKVTIVSDPLGYDAIDYITQLERENKSLKHEKEELIKKLYGF